MGNGINCTRKPGNDDQHSKSGDETNSHVDVNEGSQQMVETTKGGISAGATAGIVIAVIAVSTLTLAAITIGVIIAIKATATASASACLAATANNIPMDVIQAPSPAATVPSQL